MKIKEMLNAILPLNQVIARELPGKLAYAVAKNTRLINKELEIVNETRVKMLDAHGYKSNPDTNKYDIPEKEQSAWDKEFDDFAETEIDIPLHKVRPELFDNVTTITAQEIMALSFMIDDEEPEVKPKPKKNSRKSN